MSNRSLGYVRVSKDDPHPLRQLEAVRNACSDNREIFIDKQIGKRFHRARFQALKRSIREGDTVVLLSIEKLGESFETILSEWQHITRELKANIKIVDIPLLDTSQSGNSDGHFVADLVLQILSYAAEKERANNVRRQEKELLLAKTTGKRCGRPRISMPESFPEVYAEWRSTRITAQCAMQTMDLKPTTFYKMVQKYEDENEGCQWYIPSRSYPYV